MSKPDIQEAQAVTLIVHTIFLRLPPVDECDRSARLILADACEAGAAALRGLAAQETCAWAEDRDGVWRGSCGAAWALNETPTENHMQFCPQCGRPLAARIPIDQ